MNARCKGCKKTFIDCKKSEDKAFAYVAKCKYSKSIANVISGVNGVVQVVVDIVGKGLELVRNNGSGRGWIL